MIKSFFLLNISLTNKHRVKSRQSRCMFRMHKGYRVQAAVRIATDVRVTLTQYSWWNIQRYTERTQSSVGYIPRVIKCLFDLQVFEKDFFDGSDLIWDDFWKLKNFSFSSMIKNYFFHVIFLEIQRQRFPGSKITVRHQSKPNGVLLIIMAHSSFKVYVSTSNNTILLNQGVATPWRPGGANILFSLRLRWR